MKKLLAVCVLIITISVFSCANALANTTSIVINSKTVPFDEYTGFPFIDDNNRTMVPLRVTMETAGYVVGYDSVNPTAIVITDYGRIEVPIYTDYLYYNNTKIQNDTYSVIVDGRTYLPIRAVLEAAHYTVEWDSATNTVNAYTFIYDENKFIPYSTGSLDTLIDNVLKGYVVYVNGRYYATPEFVKFDLNPQVHYSGNDLNTAIYPQADRNSMLDFNESQIGWIAGITFEKVTVSNNQLDALGIKGIPSNIPNFSDIYAFYDSGITGINLIYCVPDMTDEFFNAQNDTGSFSGIHMKKENGVLYFSYADLKEKGIYSM